MNSRLIFACAFVAFSTALFAQDAPTVRVRVEGLKQSMVGTPQFQVSNVPAKPFRPRNWLEIETTFDAEKAQRAEDPSPFVDQLEFKYYVALNKQDKAGKWVLLTATIIYVNIPVKDKEHALAYVSPASMTRLLEKADFTQSDVKAVGVEINYGGQVVGGKSTAGKFWEKMDSFSVVDGAVLPKMKTPFAPLWGDYDVDVKPQ